MKSVAQAAAAALLTDGKPGGTSAIVNGEMLDKRMGVRVTIQETVSNLFGKS